MDSVSLAGLASAFDRPGGDRFIDASGVDALPGLSDMHAHIPVVHVAPSPASSTTN